MEKAREFTDCLTGAGVMAFGYLVTKSGRKTPFFILSEYGAALR